jgi:hypothetical protein
MQVSFHLLLLLMFQHRSCRHPREAPRPEHDSMVVHLGFLRHPLRRHHMLHAPDPLALGIQAVVMMHCMQLCPNHSEAGEGGASAVLLNRRRQHVQCPW